MTDLVTPGEAYAEADNTSMGNALLKNDVAPWIVNGIDIAGIYANVTTTGLNAFAWAGATGLDVTIDGGEAYVGGWLVRDRQTVVTVPASYDDYIYLGYDADAILGSTEAPSDSDNVIVGTAGDFADHDPRVEIWRVTSDTSAITSFSDVRNVGPISSYSSGYFNLDTNLEIGHRLRFSTGDTARLLYDENNPLLIQHSMSTAATALGINGTWLGVNQVPAPELPLHVNGGAGADEHIAFSGSNSSGFRFNTTGDLTYSMVNDILTVYSEMNYRFRVRSQVSGNYRNEFDVLYSDPNDVRVALQGGQKAMMREGEGNHREIYVSDTEPTGWSDGDLWFQPE